MYTNQQPLSSVSDCSNQAIELIIQNGAKLVGYLNTTALEPTIHISKDNSMILPNQIYYSHLLNATTIQVNSPTILGKGLCFCNDILKFALHYQFSDVILIDDFCDPRMNLRQTNIE